MEPTELFDHMLEGCQIIGVDWRYLYLNDAAAVHAHKHKGDLLRRRIMDVFPGIETTPLFRTLSTCMDTRQTAKMVNEFDNPDGTKAWFELSIQPIPEGLFIMSLDITEHKLAEDQIRKLNRTYSVLSNVNQAIVRVRDPKTLFEKVCQIAVKDGAYHRAWIGIAGASKTRLDVAACAGACEDPLSHTTLTLSETVGDQNPIGKAFHSASRVVVNDLADWSGSTGWNEAMLHFGSRSLAAFPLIVSGDVRGVFVLESALRNEFDEQEIKLLDEMAVDISFALEMADRQADREKAEEALRESERKFMAIFQHAPMAIAISSLPDGVFIDVNEAFEKLFGYKKEDAIGRTSLDLGIAPDPQVREQLLSRIKQQGFAHQIEMVLRDKTGVPIVLYGNIDLVTVGKETYILNTFDNITDIKQAELRITEEKEWFHTTLASIGDAVITTDPQGRVSFLNPVAERLIGWTLSEAVGQSLEQVFPIINEQTHRPAVNPVARVLREGLIVGMANHTALITRDGREIPIEDSAAPIKDNDGHTLGVVMVFHDVAEKRQAEQEIRSLAKFPSENPNPILRIQSNGVLLYANEASFSMLPAWPLAQGQPVPPVLQEVVSETLASQSGTVIDIEHGERVISFYVAPIPEEGYANLYGRDVTERRQAEQILRQRVQLQDQLAKISASVPGVIHSFRLRPDGSACMPFTTPVVEDLFGISQDILAKDVSPFYANVHPDDLEHVKETVAEAGRLPSPWHDEYRYLHPTKGLRWIEGWSIPQKEPDGSILWNGFVMDVTGRKQAEEALRESEEDFRSIVENSGDGITITDEQGIVIEWNQAQELLTGISRETALGRPVEDLSSTLTVAEKQPVHTRDLHQRNLHEVVRGDHPGWLGKWMELELERSDRERRQVHAKIFARPTGKGTKVGTIFRDITQQRAAEAQVRRRAEEFAALYETTLASSYQRDLTHLFELILEQATRLVGASCGFILLYDPIREDLEIAAARGAQFSPTVRVPLGKGLAGQVARTRLPLVVENYAESPIALPEFDQYHFTTIAGVPLLFAGELIGVLSVAEMEIVTRRFTEEDVHLLTLFASVAASAIHNTRLFDQVNERAAQLGLLYDAGLAINSVLEPQAQLKMLFQVAQEVLHCDRVHFFRYYPQGHQVRFEMGIGIPGEVEQALAQLRLSVDDAEGMAGWVGKHRLPIRVPNVQDDPRYLQIDPELRSGVWAPVQRGETLLGVVAVFRTREQTFTPQEERLLVMFANQAAVAMENARLFSDTQRQLERLSALRTIDLAITSSLDLNLTLDILLGHILTQLKVDAACVLLLQPSGGMLHFAAGRGFHTHLIERSKVRLGEGFSGRVALERITLSFGSGKEAGDFTRTGLLREEQFVAYTGVPLIAKGVVKGVLEIYHRSPINSDDEWQQFLATLAGQAAIAIENSQLFENLQQANTNLFMAYDATIEGWSHALDLRDRETEGHTKRVTEMTMELAKQMGIKSTELTYVRWGALLHDIGKMGIPDPILLKPGPLSDAEWDTMRKHPRYAFELLTPIAYLGQAVDIPYCHHEKWDGSGYPRGIKGEEIPLTARVFSIVDVWDALRSDRPYRAAWPKEQALQYILAEKGKSFDPKVVEAFLQVLEDYPDTGYPN